jgi:hypothetical protein
MLALLSQHCVIQIKPSRAEETNIKQNTKRVQLSNNTLQWSGDKGKNGISQWAIANLGPERAYAREASRS